MFLVIHTAADVLESVGNYEIIHVKQHVVRRNLVENVLCELYRGCLILDNHNRLRLLIIYNGVTTQAFLAHPKFHFVSHKPGRVALMLGKEVHEMLAHPFFGCQSNVFSAQKVENMGLAILFLNFYFVIG